MEGKFYTTSEIAKQLKVAYLTVYRWIRTDKLKSNQNQKQYRIKESDLNHFIEGKK